MLPTSRGPSQRLVTGVVTPIDRPMFSKAEHAGICTHSHRLSPTSDLSRFERASGARSVDLVRSGGFAKRRTPDITSAPGIYQSPPKGIELQGCWPREPLHLNMGARPKILRRIKLSGEKKGDRRSLDAKTRPTRR